MKLWYIILAVLIIILIGVGAYFLFFSKPASVVQTGVTPTTLFPTTDQTQTPDALVKGFYIWYLQANTADPAFYASAQFKDAIGNWLTPDFIAKWDSIVENTDANPVLLSQDFASSWLTSIHTDVVSEGTTTSTVLLTLGTGSETKKLIVSLTKGQNGWRINSVTPTE